MTLKYSKNEKLIKIMGIGDWGLAQSPIPNPQSPIPNPQFILIILKI